ncbi:MAG: hypothetical protein NT007_00450 [Candidatus Kapabacteria bacterium]|nr:hypothetical protein [Candidatus Kapabacteria bacterium]
MKYYFILFILLIASSLYSEDMKSYTLDEFGKLPEKKQTELRSQLTEEEFGSFFFGAAKLHQQGISDKEIGKKTGLDIIKVGRKMTQKERDNLLTKAGLNFKNDKGQSPQPKPQVQKKTAIDPEFISFWKSFQAAVKSNDKNNVAEMVYYQTPDATEHEMSTYYFTDKISFISSYDGIFNKKVKSDISKTKEKDFIIVINGKEIGECGNVLSPYKEFKYGEILYKLEFLGGGIMDIFYFGKVNNKYMLYLYTMDGGD